jgi:uncharacterized protein
VTTLFVELVYALADEQHVLQLQLSEGASIADALQVAKKDPLFACFPLQDLTTGIWGEVKPVGYLLSSGDRLELYRPLRIDPMQARRNRVKGAPAPR